MSEVHETAGVHEGTVQALARGDLDPLPRRPRGRRVGSRSSRVIEDRVNGELMAVVHRIADEHPDYRIVIESPTEVWLR